MLSRLSLLPASDLERYIESEVSQCKKYRSAITSLAYQEGILLNG